MTEKINYETPDLQKLAKEACKFFKHKCFGKNNALDITIMRDSKFEDEVYITIQSKFDLVPECFVAKINLNDSGK